MPEESLGQFAKEFRELDEPFREMLKKLEQDLSSLEEDSNVKNYLKKIEELRLLEQGLLNIKIQNARGYAKKCPHPIFAMTYQYDMEENRDLYDVRCVACGTRIENIERYSRQLQTDREFFLESLYRSKRLIAPYHGINSAQIFKEESDDRIPDVTKTSLEKLREDYITRYLRVKEAKKRHALPKNYSPEDEMFDAWCKEGYQTYIEQGSYQYTRKI